MFIDLTQMPELPTVIVLGVSAGLNILLFLASLIDLRRQNQAANSEKPSCDDEKSPGFGTGFVPSTIVLSTSPSPLPVQLHPSDQRKISYDIDNHFSCYYKHF